MLGMAELAYRQAPSAARLTATFNGAALIVRLSALAQQKEEHNELLSSNKMLASRLPKKATIQRKP